VPPKGQDPSAAGAVPEIGLVRIPGRVPYRRGLELQRALARARIDGSLGEDLLLLLEHEPVVTLGRGTGDGHLVVGPEVLAARGIDLVEIERGGDITYHGPGQVVGYPILDLRGYRRDLHWYLRTVEEALIRALTPLGVSGFRVPEHTGVWVGDESALGSAANDGRAGDAGPGAHPAAGTGSAVVSRAILEGRLRKIASIGVHVSRWITWHGFALNVTREPMEAFRLIVPCGIEGVRMTGLEEEGAAHDPEALVAAVATGFGEAFGARVTRRTASLVELEELSGVTVSLTELEERAHGGSAAAPRGRPSDPPRPADRRRAVRDGGRSEVRGGVR